MRGVWSDQNRRLLTGRGVEYSQAMQIPRNLVQSRRQFVKALTVGAPAVAWVSRADSCAAQGRTDSNTPTLAAATVRDRLWAWAHDAHCYDNSYGLPRNGRITPVEGAHYLGVPNIILIRYGGKPAPPFDQYAIPLAGLLHVGIWQWQTDPD